MRLKYFSIIYSDLLKVGSIISIFFFFLSCQKLDLAKKKASQINHYEKVSLTLARENRLLQTEIESLKFKITSLENELKFAHLKTQTKNPVQEKGRFIASVAENDDHKAKNSGRFLAITQSEASFPEDKANSTSLAFDLIKKDQDIVQDEVYKWGSKELLGFAEKFFIEKDFSKASSYYRVLIHKFKKELTGDVFIKAAISSLELSNKQEWIWARNLLDIFCKENLDSPYYLQARVWKAILKSKLGDKEGFFQDFEEFRKKYRNTDEWAIMSKFYNDVFKKHKEQK